MMGKQPSRLSIAVLGASLAASCNSPDAMFANGGNGTGGTGGSGGTGGAGAGEPLPVFSALWANRYSAAGDQRASAVAVSSSGAMIAASLQGTVSIGSMDYTSAGNADVLLIEVEPVAGAVTRVTLQGDASLQQAFALAISQQTDAAAIGGSFNGFLYNTMSNGSDAFTAFIRPDQTMWFRRQLSNEVLGTTFDDMDRVVAVGDFEDVVDVPDPDLTSVGGLDACVYWHAANGTVLQSSQLGSTANDTFTSVASDENGLIYAVGHAGGTIEQDTDQDHGGGADVMVASFDGLAQRRFLRLFGDAADQSALDIAVDPSSGEIVIVGVFEGSLVFGGTTLSSTEGADGFVAKLTSDGEPLFAFAIGGPSTQSVQAVAIDGTGRIVVTGDFEEALELGGASLVGAGKSDIFVAAFDEDGTTLSLQGFGDAASQYAEDLAIDEGDSIYLVASVQGDVDFGLGVLTAEDTSFDIVVARLAP